MIATDALDELKANEQLSKVRERDVGISATRKNLSPQLCVLSHPGLAARIGGAGGL